MNLTVVTNRSDRADLTRGDGRGSWAKRTAVAIGLVLAAAASWAYLFLLASRMGDMMSPLAMPMTSAWTGAEIALMWSMWAVMMAAMMLPSAVPMVDAYTKASRTTPVAGSVTLFVAGYVVAWSGFATLATAAQWLLHDRALITPMGVSSRDWLGGVLLVAAGLYQFTALKDACLRQCRTPLGFLATEWRPGNRGALVMGLRHGSFCVGCCWALMALLFVLGVMNLWWIAALAAVVLVEKFLPSDLLTRLLGIVFTVWGVALLMEVQP